MGKKNLNFYLNKYGKPFNCIIFIFLVFGIFGGEVMKKLALGGSWGTGMCLGMADRVLQGHGFIYSVPGESVMEVSALYFPGCTIVALISRVLFGRFAETALIVAAWVTAFIMVWLLTCISCRFENVFFSKYVVFAIAILMFAGNFSALKAYLGGWHPDFAVVLFAAASAICFDKLLRQKNVFGIWNVLFVVMLFVCALFKQTSVAFYVGFAIYILLEKDFNIKKKFFLLGHLLVAGIALLFVIFMIPGCFTLTVEAFSTQELKVSVFVSSTKGAVKSSTWFGIFLGVYYLLLLTKRISLVNRIERMWFWASHTWMLMLLINSTMEGANTGDTESGLIALLPFALYSIVWISNFLKTRYNIPCRDVNVMITVIVCVIGIFLVGNYRGIVADYKSYLTRMDSENKMNVYLTKNYTNAHIGYRCNYYTWLCNSAAFLTTDFNTAVHYVNSNMADENMYLDLYEKEKWSLIVWSNTSPFPRNLEKYYDKLSEEEIPEVARYFSLYKLKGADIE